MIGTSLYSYYHIWVYTHKWVPFMNAEKSYSNRALFFIRRNTNKIGLLLRKLLLMTWLSWYYILISYQNSSTCSVDLVGRILWKLKVQNTDLRNYGPRDREQVNVLYFSRDKKNVNEPILFWILKIIATQGVSFNLFTNFILTFKWISGS